MKVSTGLFLAAGVSLSVLVAASPSWAQGAPPSAGNQAGEQPTGDAGAAAAVDAGLGEIVVTAQRRSENVQRVPITITAVPPARLEQLNLRSVDNLQLVTPSLTFTKGFGFAQTFIRGIGSDFTTAGLESAVSTFVDGAYLARGLGTAFDLLDVGSVQVLKGPQGTLYGRNATGGAILPRTRRSTASPPMWWANMAITITS